MKKKQANILPATIKKSQAKRILRIIDKLVRVEVASKIGPAEVVPLGREEKTVREAADKLKKYIYGTSDFIELGRLFGYVKKKKKKSKKKNGKFF